MSTNEFDIPLRRLLSNLTIEELKDEFRRCDHKIPSIINKNSLIDNLVSIYQNATNIEYGPLLRALTLFDITNYALVLKKERIVSFRCLTRLTKTELLEILANDSRSYKGSTIEPKFKFKSMSKTELIRMIMSFAKFSGILADEDQQIIDDSRFWSLITLKRSDLSDKLLSKGIQPKTPPYYDEIKQYLNLGPPLRGEDKNERHIHVTISQLYQMSDQEIEQLVQRYNYSKLNSYEFSIDTGLSHRKKNILYLSSVFMNNGSLSSEDQTFYSTFGYLLIKMESEMKAEILRRFSYNTLDGIRSDYDMILSIQKNLNLFKNITLGDFLKSLSAICENPEMIAVSKISSITKNMLNVLIPLDNSELSIPYENLSDSQMDFLIRKEDLLVPDGLPSRNCMYHYMSILEKNKIFLSRSSSDISMDKKHNLLHVAAYRGINIRNLNSNESTVIRLILLLDPYISINNLWDDQKPVVPSFLKMAIKSYGNHIINEVLNFFIPDIDFEFFSDTEINRFFEKSFVIPPKNQYSRYLQLKDLNSNTLRAIANLYSISDQDIATIRRKISRKAQIHFLENLIINLDSYDTTEIIRTYGIIIPPHIADIKDYLRSNLPFYNQMITRSSDIMPLVISNYNNHGSNLEYFKDSELFEYTKIYVQYDTRKDLIIKLNHLIQNVGFFIPLVRNSRNRKTTFLTDTSDTSVFMIGYGTIESYICFEIDELMLSFRRTEEYGFRFSRPNDPKKEFSKQELQELRNLLSVYPETKELHEKISQGFIEIEERTRYDMSIKKKFDTFLSEEKSVAKLFFLEIFYAGMYMRRWKGPGYPYPLKSEETMGRESPNENVIQSMKRIREEILANATNRIRKFLLGPYYDGGYEEHHIRSDSEGIRSVEYYNGSFSQESGRFGKVFAATENGRACIRQASTKFIGTGHHYSMILMGNIIADLNIKDVSMIS